MPGRGLTYRDAGVDADLGDALVERIKGPAARTLRPGVVAGIGGFASLFSLKDALDAARAKGAPLEAMRDPLLVSGTDGVGTKLLLAILMNRHDTVGIDLVAMCVNDVLTTGAMPLFFLDYFGTGKLEVDVAEKVITGVARGCELAGLSLVGGETAELPGLYRDGEYDLAGFAVGVVERSQLIDGQSVAPGDKIIGVASSGVHSNGYSLARKAVLEHAGLSLDGRPPELGGETLGDALIRPTRIYARAVEALLARARPNALAHITGGGIPGNLPRVMPVGSRAVLDVASWPRPPIFDVIQRAGAIAEDEMARTFNLGLGLLVIVPPAREQAALAALADAGEAAWTVGEITPGTEGAEPSAELRG